ncbi:hypothetical protein F4804DRAFT_159053 [Jackrogersella minutella]|nr:hypothetical protein F4804DRAFT_159053 [Jackrogersella minutella]
MHPDSPDEQPLRAAPDYDKYKQEALSNAQERHKARTAEIEGENLRLLRENEGKPESQRAQYKKFPVLETLDDKEIKKNYDHLISVHSARAKETRQTEGNVALVEQLNTRSVSPEIVRPVHTKLMSLFSDTRTTIKMTVRQLRDDMKPLDLVTQIGIRDDYRKVLQQARLPGVKPDSWLSTYLLAYRQAEHSNIPDVQGTLAVQDFLEAVAVRIAPQWAMIQLQKLIEKDQLGERVNTIEQLCSALSGWIDREPRTKLNPPFSALSEGSGSYYGGVGSSGAPRRERYEYSCPCLNTREETHKWSPETCGVLQFAITGKSARKIEEPNKERCKEIRTRYNTQFWKELKARVETDGWKVRPLVKKGKDKGKNRSEGSGSNLAGKVVTVSIDPRLLESLQTILKDENEFAPGVYSTMEFGRHPLSDCTVVATCGSLHLVNHEKYLVKGSFELATDGEMIQAGSSSFPIKGKGTRLIPKAFRGKDGYHTGDLTLQDVVVVEGFHVNIVSEALLRSSKIWYCGMDCSLRFGKLTNGTIVRKLIRKHNLVFFEYKPVSIYPRAPSIQPICDRP